MLMDFTCDLSLLALQRWEGKEKLNGGSFLLFRKRQYIAVTVQLLQVRHLKIHSENHNCWGTEWLKWEVIGYSYNFLPRSKSIWRSLKIFFKSQNILLIKRTTAIFENKTKQKKKLMKSGNGERKRLKHLLNQMIVYYTSQPVCFFFSFLILCLKSSAQFYSIMYRHWKS